MDTLTIRKMLREYKCFKGVYALDMIPRKIRLPATIIVNTHPSYLPGEHWVCVSVDETGFGRYFDSFGLPPLHKEIFYFLDNNCLKGWKHSKRTVQNVRSDTCGQYCMLYVIFKCEGLTTTEFFSVFGRNTLGNDKLIKEIFKDFSLVKTLAY